MDYIVYAMVTTYRVVVSHDPKRPEVYYVDICRDGFCAHDLLFEMQKKFYHNPSLERVFGDSCGIKLKESRSGEVRLIYTKHRDIMAQQYQAKLRKKIDSEIMRVFKQMKAQNKLQTISVQVHEFYYDDLWKNKPQYPRSLYEENMIEIKKHEELLAKLKKIRQDYYASRKYANCPHIQLQLNQQWIKGD